MIEAKPENLIGDRAYDSDPLDAELRKDGIEMIPLHRGNRSKPPTSFAGSTTPTISSALSSLPASLSSSNDFEIGSNKREVCATNLRLQVLNVSRLNILADNKRRNSLFLAGGGAARA
jgi:hypothetical protein